MLDREKNQHGKESKEKSKTKLHGIRKKKLKKSKAKLYNKQRH